MIALPESPDSPIAADHEFHSPLLSPKLRPGDCVRLISPASFPTDEWVTEMRGVLESWGLVVELGRHALDQRGFMAGRDEDRLEDLNEAFKDSRVRAVITTVGGAGAYRIAGSMDFDAIRADPKPLLGFSDITALHLSLWEHCRLATIHGCLAGTEALRSCQRLLMTTEGLTLKRDPNALSAQIHVRGRASGPLVGGNLSTVAHAVGTKDMPSLAEAILLVEDERRIGIGRVDRQLTQLRRSGSLNGLRGVALGLFTGFDDHVDREWTVLDVLRDHLQGLGIPILGGLKIGHGGVADSGGPDQSCVSLGSTAVLDADAGTLTVGPCVYET
jgi:muramoyltetrapeptide carboxypeptidase